MSGLEVAGVLLGTFPLIISSIEHWRDVARINGFFWRLRKEYNKCLRDAEFHAIAYKRNLKELLLPIFQDAAEVELLIKDPHGAGWNDKALQKSLEDRLQESYNLYMEIIIEMNETARDLKKELSFDDVAIQTNLARSEGRKQSQSSSTLPLKSSAMASAKTRIQFEMFRAKFGVGETVREQLFSHLNQCNIRLEKLLSSSDRVSALQKATSGIKSQTRALEVVFKKAWRRAALLYKALHNAWGCSCQQYHFANLRLEHRTMAMKDTCFEVILMFMAPTIHTSWCWRELQCSPGIGCSAHRTLLRPADAKLPGRIIPISGQTSPRISRHKKVGFANASVVDPDMELVPVMNPIVLCERLRDQQHCDCMGTIGHEDEIYHLHPFKERKKLGGGDNAITLDEMLSSDFDGRISRRQRYLIALLLASSAAQLQFTPWLRTGLTKRDVLFFPREDESRVAYGEPFIQQGFFHDVPSPLLSETTDCNFFSLGVILLELCFGSRLEDHPQRKKYPVGDEQSKHAFDLVAAVHWSKDVEEEAGPSYAVAVKWCLVEGPKTSQSWRSEIIEKVVTPLEICQKHFEASTV